MAGEHVERLDAHAPEPAELDDVIAEAFVFKPCTRRIAPAFDHLAPIAPALGTVPHDRAPSTALAREIRAVLAACFEDQPVLFPEGQELVFDVLAQQPREHAL